ncbi:MAG: cell division protein ZapA, partial [Beijerinckiaceae bacterium]|nr:cell division protein ZapA [Beijerinckiaceae bacterium]
IMAAITFADEWEEANDRIRELEAELARFKASPAAAPEWAEDLASSLAEAAQRIERVAREMSDSSRG